MKITGIITDIKTGEPIVGANIIIKKDQVEGDTPFFTGAASDTEGLYITPKLSQSNYWGEDIFRTSTVA